MINRAGHRSQVMKGGKRMSMMKTKRGKCSAKKPKRKKSSSKKSY